MADEPQGVEIQVVHGIVVVASWESQSWREPEDEYEFGGTRYEVTGYSRYSQADGRPLYQVHVQPVATP
jgi:hypothetical protein